MTYQIHLHESCPLTMRSVVHATTVDELPYGMRVTYGETRVFYPWASIRCVITEVPKKAGKVKP